MEHVECLIVGATATGCAMALGLQEKGKLSVVLEPSWTLIPECTAAIRPGHYPKTVKPNSELGRRLGQECQAKGIIGEGVDHPTGIAPIIAQFLEERAVPIRFQTQILDYGREGGQWQLRVMEADGLRRYSAEKLVITEATGKFRQAVLNAYGEKLRACVYAQMRQRGEERLTPGETLQVQDGVSLEGGRFPSDAWLRVDLAELNVTPRWEVVHEVIHQLWKYRSYRFDGWRIVTLGRSFSWEGENICDVSVCGEYGEQIVLSSLFPNAIEAFEYGMMKGLE